MDRLVQYQIHFHSEPQQDGLEVTSDFDFFTRLMNCFTGPNGVKPCYASLRSISRQSIHEAAAQDTLEHILKVACIILKFVSGKNMSKNDAEF